MNRYPWAARARRWMLSAVAREGLTARAQFPTGVELFLPCWDSLIPAALLAGRVFEPLMLSVLRGLVRPGAVVIDGGAHVGFYAITAARLMQGRGIVIAFEPDPRNFVLLQRNIEWNGVQSTIRAEPIALTESDGETEMWIAGDISTCGSLVKMDLPSHRSVRVRCARLDSYVSSTGITEIDLLKLDLEGGEPACLRGAHRVVQSARAVVFELNAPRLKAQGLAPQEVVREFIRSGGFSETLLFDESNNRVTEWGGGRELESLLEGTGFMNVLLSRTPAFLRGPKAGS